MADELGLNIMLNEHHQTATCLDACAPADRLPSWRARPRRRRICILGNPVANRGEPVRIAEEMAMIDCISRGRLECGFVRGVPYEIPAANTNPTQTVERAVGRHRPRGQGVDEPRRARSTSRAASCTAARSTSGRAPISSRIRRSGSPARATCDNIRKVASRGYVFATFLQPHAKVREMFDAYRSAYVDTGLPGGGGVAYMPLVFTGDNEDEAEEGAQGADLVPLRQDRAAVPQPAGLRAVATQRSRRSRAPSPAAPTRCGARAWSSCARKGVMMLRHARSGRASRSSAATSRSAASTTC